MTPTLLPSFAHVDVDAFFASVLLRKHPHLRGKPLLALGMGGGCVIAASYEAKAFGVKTGMRFTDAKKLVPNAIAMPSDFREACQASDELESLLCNHCPIVEQMSVDEWFLDLQTCVGGTPMNPMSWARDIQRELQRATDLTVSIGVAPSKLLAKMSSEYRKPAGLTVIGSAEIPGAVRIEDFLRDRPAAAIPGIGRKRTLSVDAQNWKTAWDIAHADEQTLIKIMGRPGSEMQRELLGEAVTSIHGESENPKSISRARSFRATTDMEFVWAHVLQHLQYLVLRLRRYQLACSMVSLWLRNEEYQHSGTGLRLPQPADTEEALAQSVKICFEDVRPKLKRCTQAGLVFADLRPMSAEQPSLFDDPLNGIHRDALQRSLDKIRKQHGRGSIQRGSALSAASKEAFVPPMPLYEQQ